MAGHKTQETRRFVMLVITRRDGEAVVLEFGKERVEIAVHQVKNRQVRLRIRADDSVRVVRKELLEDGKEKASPSWDNIERM